MCQLNIALSRKTSYLLAFMTYINFLNPQIRIKQEMTNEMFVTSKTSVNALMFYLLYRTQSIAGNPTVISVTTMFTILRLLLCFSGSIPFLISSMRQDITQYLNAKSQWASLKATIFRNYIAIYIYMKNWMFSSPFYLFRQALYSTWYIIVWATENKIMRLQIRMSIHMSALW